MRKHDVRKWLHAILDLLPVILIPVFMIYSHRHDVTERTDVEINYKYQSNEVNSVDDLVEGNIYQFDELSFNNQNVYEGLSLYLIKFNVNEFVFNDFNLGEIYFGDYTNTNGNFLNIIGSNDTYWFYYLTNHNVYQEIATNDFACTFTNVVLYTDTINLFKTWCIENQNLPHYTDYNLIESVEINDTKSSVMNVFMDNFNNSIDKYFNMGNVFNLNGVYQWFNTNIFSGNAPTIIYSIWNIALYELVMDLLFLLYGLFMWFIDIVENIMNKPFKSIK